MKNTHPLFCFLFLLLTLSNCKKEEKLFTTAEILQQMEANYVQMAEQQIAISRDETVFAQYAAPVTRYSHGILGDAIEASQLIVNVDGKFHTIELTEDYVFEDIRPRLADVDSDGDLEIICIRSHLDLGAGIVIYHIENEELQQYAYVKEIGNTSRWLNIVTINDLDEDGTTELVWIQTPHIGGILKVAEIRAGELEVLDEASLYSNHGIGQTNLCLSVLTKNEMGKRFYVPNQERNKIVGFSFEGQELVQKEEIDLMVDFALPLKEQYIFEEVEEEEDNCISP